MKMVYSIDIILVVIYAINYVVICDCYTIWQS